jgi:hypothetical protein
MGGADCNTTARESLVEGSAVGSKNSAPNETQRITTQGQKQHPHPLDSLCRSSHPEAKASTDSAEIERNCCVKNVFTNRPLSPLNLAAFCFVWNASQRFDFDAAHETESDCGGQKKFAAPTGDPIGAGLFSGLRC